ncbi:hypothetical protein RF11_09084 [Thelohanellus kitauei]|uniref:DDE-1 domain-containing protein n=1 Tax=Thelohanellus kitauei TaxID=669202 RepID=A0A0C2N1Y4_THEKT|nr:hypothetical protein RF11_09084 [Thelohanellus kitauei]
MTFTILMKPASIIVLRQTVPYAINTLHCRVIKRRWIALLCYAVQICQNRMLDLDDLRGLEWKVYQWNNFAAHTHLDNLQNIQLEFLPPNTTSLVQLMDMGLIKNYKTLYRGKLVYYILESIDENLLTSSTTARDISIKTTTIQNCFTNCGTKPLDISEILSNEENGDILPIDNLTCYDNNEDCEDLIEEGIISKREKFEADDDDESPVPVTNQEAKKCMSVLQGYFMQEGNEGSPTSALNICADFVEVKCYKNKRQTTFDSFFGLK